MNKTVSTILLILLSSIFVNAQSNSNTHLSNRQKETYKSVKSYLKKAVEGDYAFTPPESADIDTIYTENDTIKIFFTDGFAYKPLRAYQVSDVYSKVKHHLKKRVKHQEIQIYVKGFELKELVRYSSKGKHLSKRTAQEQTTIQHVKNISKPYNPTLGLMGKHIALWNSHGWYYENKLDRWEWQRAHMFTTIEDLLTTSYVLPFLTPMLENAGANVYLPRERDTQVNEVIVDETSVGFKLDNNISKSINKGFIPLDTIFGNQNPFQLGKSYQVKCLPKSDKFAQWSSEVPESGNYAVYISYQSEPNSSKKAIYTVEHSGGATQFEVDQSIGSGMWVYLGAFHFSKNQNAIIKLSLAGQEDKVLSLDAVRLGGGMGNVARNGKISKRPRWNEAARYYLQFNGAPDSTVYSLSGGKNDYTDDYRSRGHWVNYLFSSIESGKGLDIPIDASFAFHTDAGHKTGIDTVVGTLLIYSTTNLAKEKVLSNGSSRLTNRDFADFVSSEIVHDIRKLHNKEWTQRELWDKRYSEATYPNVPSVLLELLSHHNLGDSRYALDPNFRFTVSRAVYKSILKYLANYYQADYVVQPLPITTFSAILENNQARLQWKPERDPLEPTAVPHYYVVYTKEGENGWDNGTFVSDSTFLTPALKKGVVYSFKVTALNEGGESFGSTELSVVYNGSDKQNVLLIDGFDRVAAPQLTYQGNFAGYTWINDEGVAWGLDFGTTGKQYEFDENIPWIDDDNPGHGASYDNLSSKTFAGNKFNHTWFHTTSLSKLGLNVSTANRQGLKNLAIGNHYDMVDIILGEQKSTILPDSSIRYQVYDDILLNFLQKYSDNNKTTKIILSGAYLGSDLIDNHIYYSDSTINLINKIFGFKSMSDNGSVESEVHSSNYQILNLPEFQYNREYDNRLYRVESPDAIVPIDKNGTTILRYSDNNKSAAVFYDTTGQKVISLGFPIETINKDYQRDLLFKELIKLITK